MARDLKVFYRRDVSRTPTDIDRPSRRPCREGFTLVELLVSIGVLAFLVLIVAQIVSMASGLSGSMGSRLNSYDQARTVFNRMEVDVAGIPKHPGADYLIGTDGSASDAMYFYSEVQGYASSAPTSPSSLSLVGYRVNTTAYDLEHLAFPLNWDDMLFLIPNLAGGTFAPLSSTVMATATPPLSTAMAASNFHSIGDGVFRMEVFYFLKDGTFSVYPIISPVLPAGKKSNLSATGAPTPSNDSSQSYCSGSRWYDTAGLRGYVCQSAATGQAVWAPIGWQDVNALVVTLGILDPASHLIATNGGWNLGKVAKAFTPAANSDTSLDASPPVLPIQAWNKTIAAGGLVGLLPTKVASAVRVYQHFIYLNTPNAHE
ncbi:MAG TPA: prepilin-type N-terminal cleavage/methylation domain-containing protein [Candidatus Methylacidiphilales bacterium]